ncbi:MAG: nuclear transport factor 2 family protein [Marinilabiliaceae bacterium]|jgi:ketosteroid isomerase-like protein|nr:nuclear transport factor 2 family protein [Marinilabiliaceae bacterium]
MRSILILFIATLFIVSCSNKASELSGDERPELSKTDREEIMNTFMLTQEAWNNYDIEGFMSAYWNSDKLVFTGVGGPTYGYQATLENYKKNYPDQETMGLLKFTVVDLYRIDNSSSLMIGKFYLSRKMGDLVGYYTLVWQKIDGKWKIISDHSSGQLIK